MVTTVTFRPLEQIQRDLQQCDKEVVKIELRRTKLWEELNALSEAVKVAISDNA